MNKDYEPFYQPRNTKLIHSDNVQAQEQARIESKMGSFEKSIAFLQGKTKFESVKTVEDTTRSKNKSRTKTHKDIENEKSKKFQIVRKPMKIEFDQG